MSNNSERMPSSKRISFNPDNCTACLCCELACSAAHFGAYSNSLSAIRIKADFQHKEYIAYVCRQCSSASCVDACKFGAIKFDEETGARYIDDDLCVNCGQCVKACPFSEDTIPLIHKDSFEEKNTIVKCDLCHDIEGGPSCVAVCPRNALTIID